MDKEAQNYLASLSIIDENVIKTRSISISERSLNTNESTDVLPLVVENDRSELMNSVKPKFEKEYKPFDIDHFTNVQPTQEIPTSIQDHPKVLADLSSIVFIMVLLLSFIIAYFQFDLLYESMKI